jgi:hypothetical protein
VRSGIVPATTLAASYRTTTHVALAIGVVGNQVLVPLELDPSNIAGVVVMDQNLPLLPIAAEVVAQDSLPPASDRYARPAPAVGVGAGVHRVRQHVIKRVVNRRLPLDLAFAATLYDRRDRDILLSEP